MSIRMMQNELQQWAAWSRSTERTMGLKQYESPTYSMLRQNVHQGHRAGVVVLLDDTALMVVDQLVQMLKRSRPDLYFWVDAHYLHNFSVNELARLGKMARYKVDGFLLAAESWLDCRLESLCEIAA